MPVIFPTGMEVKVRVKEKCEEEREGGKEIGSEERVEWMARELDFSVWFKGSERLNTKRKHWMKPRRNIMLWWNARTKYKKIKGTRKDGVERKELWVKEKERG